MTDRNDTMIGSWQVSLRGIGLNELSAEQKARQAWVDADVDVFVTHLSTDP